VLVEEAQIAGLMSGPQLFQEEPPEQPREHAHRQEEPWPARARDPGLALCCLCRVRVLLACCGGETAAGYDHMNVGVVCHGRSPGMEHGGDADLGAQVLGIGCYGERWPRRWP